MAVTNIEAINPNRQIGEPEYDMLERQFESMADIRQAVEGLISQGLTNAHLINRNDIYELRQLPPFHPLVIRAEIDHWFNEAVDLQRQAQQSQDGIVENRAALYTLVAAHIGIESNEVLYQLDDNNSFSCLNGRAYKEVAARSSYHRAVSAGDTEMAAAIKAFCSQGFAKPIDLEGDYAQLTVQPQTTVGTKSESLSAQRLSDKARQIVNRLNTSRNRMSLAASATALAAVLTPATAAHAETGTDYAALGANSEGASVRPAALGSPSAVRPIIGESTVVSTGSDLTSQPAIRPVIDTVIEQSIDRPAGVMPRVEQGHIVVETTIEPEDVVVLDNSPERRISDLIKKGNYRAAAIKIGDAYGDGQAVETESTDYMRSLMAELSGRLKDRQSRVDESVFANLAYLSAVIRQPSVIDNLPDGALESAFAASDADRRGDVAAVILAELSQLENGGFDGYSEQQQQRIVDLIAAAMLALSSQEEVDQLLQSTIESADDAAESSPDTPVISEVPETPKQTQVETRAGDIDAESVRLDALVEHFKRLVEDWPSHGYSLQPMDVDEVIAMVEEAAKKYPHDVIDTEFIAAVLWQESKFDPNAVSHAGAQGIAQFMPDTAEEWVNGDPFDPKVGIDASFRYYQYIYKFMQDRFPDKSKQELFELTLAGYNRGPSGTAKVGRVPQNGETEEYVARISDLIEAVKATQDQAEDEARASAEEREIEVTYVGWGAGLGGDSELTYYNQTDAEWRDYAYRHEDAAEGDLYSCGCGPVAYASVISTLTGKTVTPKEVADFFMELGAPLSEDSCASKHVWDTNPEAFERRFGIAIERIDLSDEAFGATIENGGMVFMSQGTGIFTAGEGHLMALSGMRVEGESRSYLVSDPNGRERTQNRDGYTAEQIIGNGHPDESRERGFAKFDRAWSVRALTAEEVEAREEARREAEEEAERQRQAEAEIERQRQEAEAEARHRADAERSAEERRIDDVLEGFPEVKSPGGETETRYGTNTEIVIPGVKEMLEKARYSTSPEGQKDISLECRPGQEVGGCSYLCSRVAARIWGYENSGQASAIGLWNDLQRRGKTHPGDTEPPIGALVFWAGDAGGATKVFAENGHVAIYIGDGKAVSNQSSTHSVDVMMMDYFDTWNGSRYLGWAYPAYTSAEL